jgi:hypothetical protein
LCEYVQKLNQDMVEEGGEVGVVRVRPKAQSRYGGGRRRYGKLYGKSREEGGSAAKG